MEKLPNRSSEALIAELQERKRQIDARIAVLSAREQKRCRELQVRRCMILGQIILEDIRKNPKLREYMNIRLSECLSKKDQSVFDESFWKSL